MFENRPRLQELNTVVCPLGDGGVKAIPQASCRPGSLRRHFRGAVCPCRTPLPSWRSPPPSGRTNSECARPGGLQASWCLWAGSSLAPPAPSPRLGPLPPHPRLSLWAAAPRGALRPPSRLGVCRLPVSGVLPMCAGPTAPAPRSPKALPW